MSADGFCGSVLSSLKMSEMSEEIGRFRSISSRLQRFVYGKSDERLNEALDDLNALDYSSKFCDEEMVASLLRQCCHLIAVQNEELIVKFSWLILNTLNRQKLVLLHDLDAVVEFLLKALPQHAPKAAALILRALATVLYENSGRTARFHEELLGSITHLIGALDSDVRRSAVQCLQNITLRVPNDAAYLLESHQRLCCQCFLQVLQTAAPAGLSETIHCKIIISVFKGLQNVISGQKSFPKEFTGSLLAAIQVYIVFGQPGVPSVIPSSLYSVPLAQYETQSTANRSLKDENPKAASDETKSSAKGKTAAKKSRRTRSRNKKADDTRDLDETVDSFADGGHSAKGCSSDATAAGFWLSLASSDSDVSDTECVGAARLLGSTARVRVNALVCFHALIKVIERRIMFGYWPSFIPDTNDVAVTSTKLTLFTVILKDPSHKVRCAALGVLNALLDGSKQYLMAAEDAGQYPNAPFTTFYVTVGYMIKEIHRCLLQVLGSEPSAIVIIQIIKCLSVLVANVPYQRLQPGLLSRIVRQIRPYLSHRDANIRVACLTCLGNVVSIHAPMIEVYHLLLPQKRSTGLSEQDARSTIGGPDESFSNTADPTLATKESGYSSSGGGVFSSGIVTPVLTSGVMTPTASESGEQEMSWLVRLCLRNVLPSISDPQSPESSETAAHPLPVRLESLQLLSQIARGYFIVLRPHLEMIRDLMSSCLQGQDCSVQLHGAKLLDAVGSMILHQQSGSATDVTLEQALSLWLPLMNGPIQNAVREDVNQTVKATVCDCLSNIGSDVFEKLPSDKRILCITLLLGFSGDDDHHVKAAATRALGCYIVYPCLREDILFVADTANALILAASEPILSVRWRAAWSLSNLSDALLLNKSDGNDEFLKGFSQLLLTKLFQTAVKLCSDNEKARSNGIRTLGNLLRYLPENLCENGRFRQLTDDSVSVIIKNVVNGTVKVRWNASYAVGNIFRNENLHCILERHLSHVFSALLISVRQCKNFKVRISATSALAVPSQRTFYGDASMFVGIWDGLVDVLASLEADDKDFSEFRYQDSLIDQICKTLMHLASLVAKDDLPDLLKVILRTKSDFIAGHIERFYHSMTEKSDKEQIDTSLFLKISSHLEMMKLVETTLSPCQSEAIGLLFAVFSTPEPSLTPSQDLEHLPLQSGFRQMYD